MDWLLQVIIGYAAVIAMTDLLRILVVAAQRARLRSVFVFNFVRLVSAPTHEAFPVAGVAAQDGDQEFRRVRHVKDVLKANRTVYLLHVVLEKTLLRLKKNWGAIFNVSVAKDS